MTADERTKKFQAALLRWYARKGRDLPWRHTKDPYAIAVSEVMLQQTQVDRVRPKYLAWLERWPTVKALANAELRDVLAMWSGLGYNSRAVRLRDMARRVSVEGWPRTVDGLLELPGIGPYTAAAIAVFAFQIPAAAIDTNVERVLSRVFFGARRVPNRRQLAAIAARVVPRHAPDDWHHAVMDHGAMTCVSRRPRCETCPVRTLCRAYPAILEQPKTSRKSQAVPFVQTDRYWRGRIVATVVQRKTMSSKALRALIDPDKALDTGRYRRLVRDLAEAGLLNLRGGKVTIPL